MIPIRNQIEAIKTRHLARQAARKACRQSARRGEAVEYDYAGPHAQSDHSQHVTFGYLKAERLLMKNMRRAKAGLPPKATYAHI